MSERSFYARLVDLRVEQLTVMVPPIILVSIVEGSPPLSARVNPLTKSGGKVYLGLSHHSPAVEIELRQHEQNFLMLLQCTQIQLEVHKACLRRLERSSTPCERSFRAESFQVAKPGQRSAWSSCI